MSRILKCIGFYTVYAFFWLTGWFPLPCLYNFSGILYLFVYYLVPYRKKVVFRNLQNSFPEKTEQEIRTIAKKFYRHFCDYFVEMVHMLHMSREEWQKRFVIRENEALDRLYKQGKSILVVVGHYANWEWAVIFPLHIPHKILALYKPLENEYFDRLFIRFRAKFGVEPVPMEKILRRILEYQKKGQPVMTYMLADQRPIWQNIQYWTTFLNQDTPVFLGPEKIAKKLDHPVFFMKVNKIRRGRYQCELIPLVENSAGTKGHEITDRYIACLEEIIRERPELWLWTHKRWKHDRKKFEASIS